jgi:periplasmic divalent cation tolerance protein
MSLIAVMTTIDDRDAAGVIARALVDKRLAACVQISEIRSVYRWEGAVEEDSEFRLLIKTTRERFSDVESLIKALHSYDLPAVVALELSLASAEYCEWVLSSCD